MIIDQLPALVTAGNNDEIAIEVGTTTYKIKKSDFLKEFMPKSGGEFTGDVAINGILDVTQRRCSATLSQAGWHRVCELQYTSGSVLDLSIGIGSTLARKITLMFPSVALAKFVDEISIGTGNNVFDKIRFMGIGGSTQKCYVDLHYNASSATNVSVFWTPTGNWTNSCISKNLQSVADSPSGETPVTEYTFSDNTITDISSSFALNTSVVSGLTGKIHAIHDASSGLVHLNFSVYTTSSMFGTSTPIFTCSNSRYTPKATTYGNGMIRMYNGEWYPYEVCIGTTGNIFQSLTSDATRVYGQITYQV